MISTETFYNDLADDYHLIFPNWKQAIARQGEVFNQLVLSQLGVNNAMAISLLDCSCGIGTQAIGLAEKGFQVTASDLSPQSIRRAEKEALSFQVEIDFAVADFRTLTSDVSGSFDVVLSADNAIPHLLTDEDLFVAAQNLYQKLENNGLLIITIRDYDEIIKEKPKATQPRIFDEGRVIVFQVWDWSDDENIYTTNHFIMKNIDGYWQTKHTKTKYRALLREELSEVLRQVGFEDIDWHLPEATGYYQPIVTARKGS